MGKPSKEGNKLISFKDYNVVDYTGFSQQTANVWDPEEYLAYVSKKRKRGVIGEGSKQKR